jgi:NAD(P)-dependent dehydrogenase (short-subunit alcohol dehydrogenase family)
LEFTPLPKRPALVRAHLVGRSQERRIRVNVVSPGTIITPGYKNELGLSDQQIGQMEEQTAATSPSGRTGTPDEVAKAVLFLASMTAATSTVSNCSLMAVQPRFRVRIFYEMYLEVTQCRQSNK